MSQDEDQSDQTLTVNLSELKAAAEEYTKDFKAGDRVVIDYSYVGIWAELGGLTGTLLKVRPKDAMWAFDIALDHPQLIGDTHAWNSTEDGGLYASMGIGGVFLLEEIKKDQPEVIPKLNHGLGLTVRPACTEAPALTNVNERIAAVEARIKTARTEHEKNLHNLIEIRKRHVDSLPEIVAAEETHAQAEQERNNYCQTDQKDTEVWKQINIREYETREAAWNLFQQKHQEAKATIPELGQASAAYEITSKEFYAFEQQKLSEIDDIIHEYLGRRHLQTESNGQTYSDQYDFHNQPMKCVACRWAFEVRERED